MYWAAIHNSLVDGFGLSRSDLLRLLRGQVRQQRKTETTMLYGYENFPYFLLSCSLSSYLLTYLLHGAESFLRS